LWGGIRDPAPVLVTWASAMPPGIVLMTLAVVGASTVAVRAAAVALGCRIRDAEEPGAGLQSNLTPARGS
jgi:hypothetical protein